MFRKDRNKVGGEIILFLKENTVESLKIIENSKRVLTITCYKCYSFSTSSFEYIFEC